MCIRDSVRSELEMNSASPDRLVPRGSLETTLAVSIASDLQPVVAAPGVLLENVESDGCD